ncbi:MAG: SPASM domain-containing protein [Candidatus Eremiobacteraeota bacterium]|nr:SPASM domain-containing protein [Candidatus Eremiobacteraeota bacterium]
MFPDELWQGRFHLIRRLGLNILVDGETGAIYELDKVAGDAFLSGKFSSAPEIEEEFRQVLSISGKERIEEASRELEESPRLPRAMCLHVAEDCNLACKYCFRGDATRKKLRMHVEDARDAVDFLLSMPNRSIELDYFGGEPLLNWPLLEEVIPYAIKRAKEEGKSIKQALTSNCILLDEKKLKFLCDHEVSLTLSLDGPPHIHDRFRVTEDGKGSWHKVFPNLIRAVRYGRDVCVRGTYTRETINFADTVRFLVEEAGIKILSLEPVTGYGEWGITDSDLDEIEKQYEKLAVYYDNMRKDGRSFDFYHFRLPLYNFPCLEKRMIGCGAGAEYLALGADGYIYPCHRFVSNKDWIMGKVKEPVWETDIHRKFRRNSWIKNPVCSSCWARLFCGGGCPASRYEANGDIDRLDELSCSIFKLRLEFAIVLEILRIKNQVSYMTETVTVS